jgi:nucleotide-binding universal stress UspA family protein
MLMKILVPTDFSTNAKIAVQFAVGLARQAQAALYLVHVLPEIGPKIGRLPSELFVEELQQRTEDQFTLLSSEIQAEDLTVIHRVAYGESVEEVIEPYAKTYGMDLIVMGSTGASGLKKLLLGSNTVDVINNSSIPVLVVPEDAAFTPVSKLVYASDLLHYEEEVKCLLPLTKALQVAIKIIHVAQRPYLDVLDTESLVSRLKEQTAYPQISMELIAGEDIISAIEESVVGRAGEILVMFTNQASLSDQLLSRSITREVAWHNRVPLLVFHKQ